MKRVFRPGDVAMVDGRVAFAWIEDGDGDRVSFLYVDGDGFPCSVWANGVLDARPLAVIDPEDGEQVERLREIASRWADQVPYSDMREPGDMDHTDAMQAALREYADPKPPKPEEPTGRYAVVVDDEGREWLRTGWDYGMDKPWQCEATHAHWQTVNAVRVLSEGVTE